MSLSTRKSQKVLGLLAVGSDEGEKCTHIGPS